MTYVVISAADNTTLGPFDTEQAAIDWAKTIKWPRGYTVRRVHSVAKGGE